jgi:hypothetical protein
MRVLLPLLLLGLAGPALALPAHGPELWQCVSNPGADARVCGAGKSARTTAPRSKARFPRIDARLGLDQAAGIAHAMDTPFGRSLAAAEPRSSRLARFFTQTAPHPVDLERPGHLSVDLRRKTLNVGVGWGVLGVGAGPQNPLPAAHGRSGVTVELHHGW